MANADKPTAVEAIGQIIAEGNAMDFVDVAEAVQKRFDLDVTASQVEQVVYDLVNKQNAPEAAEPQTPIRSAPRVGVEMMSTVTDDTKQEPATDSVPTEPVVSQPGTEPVDAMTQALQFVKSVNGLENAKRALAALESVLMGK